MSAFQIQEAKNGSYTASIDGLYLHSRYNPEREAEQFVSQLSIDFEPQCVLIIEPALSYCTCFLKKRFPKAELGCIRLISENAITEADVGWDYVLYASGDSKKDAESLFNHFGEEKLCALLAAAWPASDRILKNGVQNAWNAIKESVKKSRDVLYTRSYFSKRWLKNSFRLAYFLQKEVTATQGSLPVVLAASGPSLQSVITLLKSYRERFFLLAVSSAYLPLVSAGIFPDMVMTTDGGYWAKKHIDVPGFPCPAVCAVAAEGAFPWSILEKTCVLPLTYGQSPAEELYAACSIPSQKALRNGTVSGTALSFALSLTTNAIFCCGLDLCPATGFQHTQPNALELREAGADYRLRTQETRQAGAQCSSAGSLALYREWFIQHAETIKERVFRLSDNYRYAFSLSPLQDVDGDFFRQRTHCWQQDKKPTLQLHSTQTVQDQKRRRKQLHKTANEILLTDRWNDELFPLEALMLKRCLPSDTGKIEMYQKKIAQGKKELLVQLTEVLHD